MELDLSKRELVLSFQKESKIPYLKLHTLSSQEYHQGVDGMFQSIKLNQR